MTLEQGVRLERRGASTRRRFGSLGLRSVLLCGCIACGTSASTPVAPEDTGDGLPRFGLPVIDRDAIELVIGMDHDPTVHEGPVAMALCVDHAGRTFPACYDEHTGTDFTLRGGFVAMDAGPPDVVAAADGVVVETQDGFFDRCRVQDLETWCNGGPIEANYVVVEHEGGWTSGYWHLQKDSVQVQVGDDVHCGQVLGRIGSSGYSSLPHLHFEVWDPQGATIDPYAGELSQAFSLWEDQGRPGELPAAGCALD